ncbi:hypothetical protein OKC48_13715 [Methylorubrum extorquens]|uniref:hypothetical protein n=1 Tax=Methylorubrum extorquens TaxID=408 RepID=UPI0022388A1F|nr:hypothetical protein [Methylorubrum extorquens]UYW29513.1 hypothetical protein OKC48_13715 [Methylorubrum extorquens]
MKFVVSAKTPDGPLSYQTASPEIALARGRTLAEMWQQDVTIQDINGRVYDLDAFDTCFVRSASADALPSA